MTRQPPARIRRGLPRVPGGAPWPVVDDAVLAAVAAAAAPAVESVDAAPAVLDAPAPTAAAAAPGATTSTPVTSAGQALPLAGIRQGLPRVAGGAPWPPQPSPEYLAAHAAQPVAAAAAAETPAVEPVAAVDVAAGAPAVTPSPASAAPPAQPAAPAASPAQPAAPTRTAPAQLAAEPARRAPSRLVRTVGWVVAVVAAAAVVVLLSRWLIGLPAVAHFVHTYSGAATRQPTATPGLPIWLEATHYLNALFMLLIIRSGLAVRREKRPPASWSPKWNPARKISLTVWFHQSLDLLWVVNGVVFLVLLFSTGQWARIVPTSWSVVPNALSAALQYASLNWPTEDGWVYYNSLQLLAYFATVFLAAPLAMLTGFRMSGLWPKKNQRLSAAYPITWARAVHFPVMLYFCAFIVVHVGLVLSTGALRNLNHMFGHSDTTSWLGFWIFLASIAVMAGAWAAARPLVLTPIASVFGKVGR
ncbi:MAG: cytochrome b/b6 domain-containing protein [Microbacteriaceae bacterium]|nr:cytochrome b/b6 domain-containing protein [Microbacteriaceae bacterium]MCL2794329.1 cytochrome b/b6 domain-containing protein [Microbacteriaceae bacterium]